MKTVMQLAGLVDTWTRRIAQADAYVPAEEYSELAQKFYREIARRLRHELLRHCPFVLWDVAASDISPSFVDAFPRRYSPEERPTLEYLRNRLAKLKDEFEKMVLSLSTDADKGDYDCKAMYKKMQQAKTEYSGDTDNTHLLLCVAQEMLSRAWDMIIINDKETRKSEYSAKTRPHLHMGLGYAAVFWLDMLKENLNVLIQHHRKHGSAAMPIAPEATAAAGPSIIKPAAEGPISAARPNDRKGYYDGRHYVHYRQLPPMRL